MKTTIFNIAVILLFTIHAQSSAQNLVASEAGVLQFETEEIDFGTIQKGANGERVFTFKNTGTVPIIIAEVKTSCGCTVPSKPKGPIMPGAMSQIEVKYDTKRIGAFSKTITVLSNASEPRKMLKIKGKVVDPENKLGQ